MKYLFSIVVLLNCFQVINSQETGLFLGANIPLNYSVGVNYRLDGNFSFTFQTGLLTKPYNAIIVDVIEYFKANESVVNILRDAKSRGINFQTGLKYHFNKGYVGASYACLLLTLEDYMENILYNYTGLNMELPRNSYLTLNSWLHNGGVLVGRKFMFNDPRFSINTELGIQKNFYSSSRMKNDTGQQINSLSEIIDEDLFQYYLYYGILPSINIYFTYTFRR